MGVAVLAGFLARGTLAGLAAAFALNLQLTPVHAQGSTGGSIGKQDKSVSGGQDGGENGNLDSDRPA